MPPPGARAGAGGIDEDDVHPAFHALERFGLDRRADLQVADPCPLAAPDGVGQAAGVAVVGEDLTAVVHGRRQGQGLATAAGAEVEHLLALDLAGHGGGDLGAEVLDLEPALGEGRDRFHGRRAVGGLRRGYAEGRVEQAGRLTADQGHGLRAALEVGLEGVDAQVHRRPVGQGRHLPADRLAEDPRQVRLQPVEIVARDRRGGARQRDGIGQMLLLGLAERAEAVLFSGGLGDPLRRPLPDVSQDADHHPARTGIAHHPAQRAFAAQGVQHQAGHEGPILGAGIARALAPAFQRHPHRKMPRLDLGQNLDRR